MHVVLKYPVVSVHFVMKKLSCLLENMQQCIVGNYFKCAFPGWGLLILYLGVRVRTFVS